MRKIFYMFLMSIILSSCWKWRSNNGDGFDYNQKVMGNKIIYQPLANALIINYIDSAHPVKNPGKIYVKDNFIYQAEQGKGIHIIDNTIPGDAHRIGFIEVYGCTEIAIKGNSLYTNNLNDLVVIDISNLNNVHVTKRVENTFPGGRYQYFQSQSPPSPGYYECANPDSGVILEWRRDSITPQCYFN